MKIIFFFLRCGSNYPATGNISLSMETSGIFIWLCSWNS